MQIGTQRLSLADAMNVQMGYLLFGHARATGCVLVLLQHRYAKE